MLANERDELIARLTGMTFNAKGTVSDTVTLADDQQVKVSGNVGINDDARVALSVPPDATIGMRAVSDAPRPTAAQLKRTRGQLQTLPSKPRYGSSRKCRLARAASSKPAGMRLGGGRCALGTTLPIPGSGNVYPGRQGRADDPAHRRACRSRSRFNAAFQSCVWWQESRTPAGRHPPSPRLRGTGGSGGKLPDSEAAPTAPHVITARKG